MISNGNNHGGENKQRASMALVANLAYQHNLGMAKAQFWRRRQHQLIGSVSAQKKAAINVMSKWRQEANNRSGESGIIINIKTSAA